MAKTIDKLDKSVQQTLDMSGYATTNHGTHVTFTTTAPKVAGTAAVGSATTVSRSDHVHPLQTTVSGNAGTATKLATARTLTIGSTGKAFDGSANVSWSLSDIGALPAAGGNVTGNIKVTNDSCLEWNRNTDYARISFKNTGDSDSDSYMYFLTGDNGNEYFKFSSLSGSTTTDLLTIKTDHLRFKGYNVYHTGNKPTLADIGAAASSHGTHVTYSSTSPKVAGTASVGSEGTVARGDHVHAAQTSVSGNAGSATKLATARNIVIGNKTNSFNGTANITYTLSDIGAAASGHKHGLLHDNLTCTLENTATDNGWSMINSSYNGFLLKSIRTNASAPNWICGDYSAGIAFGGADTKGVISTTYNSPSIRFAGGNGAKPVWWINLTGTSGTSYNLANFENKNHGTHVTYSTTAPKVAGTAAVGSAANVARGDHVHPAQTSVSGNAGTATKLATARTLTIGSTGKTFNGSANVSWSLSEIGAAASSHTHSNIVNQDTRDVNTTPDGAPIGLSVHLKNNGKDGLSDGGTYHSSFFIKGWNDYSGGPYGNLAITANNNLWFRASSSGTAWNSWKKVSVDGHTHSYAGSGSAGGAANSATKLATARNIKLGGLLSGSASFNGTADATISASITKPPKSGDWFSGGIPVVNTDGVMEIGKYIDFHNTDASTNDYDVRLQCNTSTPCVITLPTSTSTLATTAQTGTLSSLKTKAKGNLVAAINEVFQSGNDVKKSLVDTLVAKGMTDASTSKTWTELINMIKDFRNVFKLNGIFNPMSCGDYYSVAVKGSRLYVAGQNSNGQLGLGNTETVLGFTASFSVANVAQIATGAEHVLVLTKDGTLYGAGSNFYGQLGLGTSITKAQTFTVLDTEVEQISCGAYYSMILKNNGELWVAGQNSYGQLGLGNTNNVMSWTRSTMSNIVRIACHSAHASVLRDDGTVWTCGLNGSGQLGLGDTTNRAYFSEAISLGSDVVDLAIGSTSISTMAIKKDGTVWGCGYNAYGQIGTGNTNNVLTFTKLSITNVSQIAVGYYHTLFLKKDGTVYSCGRNTYGQLGLGTTTNTSTITKCTSTSVTQYTIKGIEVGELHSLIYNSNNQLLGCGYNSNGQLNGNGTSTYTTFTNLISLT